MDESRLRYGVLTLATITYLAVASVFLSDGLRVWLPSSLLSFEPAIQIIVGGLGITVTYRVLEVAAWRIWARKVVGTWFYRSDSGNFAIVRIRIRRGRLIYGGNLYRTAEQVADVRKTPVDRLLRRSSSTQHFAAFESRMTSFDGTNLRTDYHILRAEEGYPRRKGILTLELGDDSRTMRGFWHSTVAEPDAGEKTTLRTGTLDLHRWKGFRVKYVDPEDP